MVDHAPRCGPAGGSPVRDAGHVCRTHAFRSVTIQASIDLYRRSARAHELSRRAQRTASTLIPRAPSEVGVVDPAAGATRAQAPDTRMWLNARKVEDETSSVFARKHPVGKVECLAFQRAIPNLLNPTTRPSGPLDRPDLESRSATLDIGRE